MIAGTAESWSQVVDSLLLCPTAEHGPLKIQEQRVLPSGHASWLFRLCV